VPGKTVATAKSRLYVLTRFVTLGTEHNTLISQRIRLFTFLKFLISNFMQRCWLLSNDK
jgi:hypothetical protein